MNRYGIVSGLLLAFGLTGIALAHEVGPGYLELHEIDARNDDLLGKVPAKGDKRLAPYVRLPNNCERTVPASRFGGGAYIERWRATCEGELDPLERRAGGLCSWHDRGLLVRQAHRVDGIRLAEAE